jgi:hypothetical protein
MTGPYFPGYVVKGGVSDITATAEHELGRLTFDRGRILQYVKFASGAAKYNWMELDVATTAGDDKANTVRIVAGDGATGAVLGVAEYGATANNYGWITRFGGATAKVAVTSAIGVPLTNPGNATGVLSTLQSATILQSTRGYGFSVGTPSITGTYVNVNCL